MSLILCRRKLFTQTTMNDVNLIFNLFEKCLNRTFTLERMRKVMHFWIIHFISRNWHVWMKRRNFRQLYCSVFSMTTIRVSHLNEYLFNVMRFGIFSLTLSNISRKSCFEYAKNGGKFCASMKNQQSIVPMR